VHPDELSLWTEEITALMFRARTRRMERMRNNGEEERKRVTDAELFKTVGVKPRVIQRVN
jgi:hypothetical protein